MGSIDDNKILTNRDNYKILIANGSTFFIQNRRISDKGFWVGSSNDEKSKHLETQT